jgi:hypothetical protein
MRRDVRTAVDVDGSESNSCKPSPKQDDGAVCVRWVRCGRSWCRCMSGGPQHGPYYARYWWQDGRRHKTYVRQAEAPLILVACADRQQREREARAQANEAHEQWRRIRAQIREYERAGY